MAKKKRGSVISLLQIQGRWRFDGGRAEYLGPDEERQPVGVCIAASRFRSGLARVKARMTDPLKGCARVVIGYNPATGGYYSVGIGGYEFAYVVDQFTPGKGWGAVEARGSRSQLESGRDYDLHVDVRGQRVSLSVNDVGVLDVPLPSPLRGDQAGLFAWGTEPIQFGDFQLSGNEPLIFVVMQFGGPYDELYKEVIEPVASRLGFRALRADDVFRPGVILQDIRRGIIESDVIVAEITPAVRMMLFQWFRFKELSDAHATRCIGQAP